jgi:farnesyl diphosphate synthase
LEYNVPGGRLLRGLAVIDSVESIKRRPLSDKEYLQAAVLGWSVELVRFPGLSILFRVRKLMSYQLNAYFIVADDIIDASLTRREQPCWYQKPGVGMVAINDSAMLSSAVYRLLKSHFKNEPYYLNIVELFLECTWQTEIGQLVDSVTSPENVRTDLSNFSLELYVPLLFITILISLTVLLKSITHCRVESSVLFMLPSCCACNAHVRHPRHPQYTYL